MEPLPLLIREGQGPVSYRETERKFIAGNIMEVVVRGLPFNALVLDAGLGCPGFLMHTPAKALLSLSQPA
jgi:hypothetical protein